MINDITVFSNAVMLSQKDIEEIKSIEIATIKDNESYILAGDMLSSVKRTIDMIDGRRTDLKAPILAEGKKIDGTFKPMIDIAKGFQTKLENGMKEWARKEIERKEAWIKEQRAKEQAEMEAEKNRLAQVAVDNEKTDAFTSEMAMGIAASIEEQQVKDASREVKAIARTLGGEGKMSSSKKWVFEIEVATAVPREYCEPVESIIRKAVQSGVRDIPGVKIYEDIKFINR